MKKKTPIPSVNQILIFQFRSTDKFKIYSHARNHAFKIQLFKKDKYLLGVHIPEKSLSNGNVFLNQEQLKNYLQFVSALSNNRIKFFLKVYDEKYFCDFTV